MPSSDGVTKWKLRIAANALRIAIREIENEASHKDTLQTVLTDLEAIDMSDLSEKIKAGHYDDRFEILQENYSQLPQ